MTTPVLMHQENYSAWHKLQFAETRKKQSIKIRSSVPSEWQTWHGKDKIHEQGFAQGSWLKVYRVLDIKVMNRTYVEVVKINLNLRHATSVMSIRAQTEKDKKNIYSRSSRKRPPRKFEIVVVTRDGRLREWAFISDRMIKKLIEGGRLREL